MPGDDRHGPGTVRGMWRGGLGRRGRPLTAATLAALFAATSCASGGGSSGRTGSTPTSSPTSSTTTLLIPPSENGPRCTTHADGTTSCVVPGRPLRRRRRRGLLLPDADADANGTGDNGTGDDEARAEYASVASFAELALRLVAVGAPPALVAACHRAALDEIRHAETVDSLAGRRRHSGFGPIPRLLGRRVGTRTRSRRVEIRRLATESFVDGWLNEGQAACELRHRAARATSDHERRALTRMAADEQRHADLARDIVTWCFREEPRAVSRALAPMA